MKNRRRPQNALQRPMVRWSWFFLLPMVSAFAIGFVWPTTAIVVIVDSLAH